MASNKTLAKAKEDKNDEYYTQLSDIENELKHYRHHFKDKIILCNCDDPYESNFFKYFAMNFNFLGLKKLIATCYNGSPVAYTQLSIFDLDEETPKEDRIAYKVEITSVEDLNGDGAIDLDDVEAMLQIPGKVQKLKGNGDFRSEECIALLKEADIVVTNPPFSLFREYIGQLEEYNKKYIIISNPNALHYKEVFPLIRDNKLWIGYKSMCSDMLFNVSKEFGEYLLKTKKEGSGYKIINGEMKGRAQAIWVTNLDIPKHHEDLILYKTYKGHEEEYPKFDNFNAINVNKVADIPMDYDGIMGVPDSFLDSFNPEQFEVFGRSGDTDWVFNECEFFTPPSDELIAKYKKMNKTWRLQNVYILENSIPKILYSRIFIRKKVQ